MSLPSQFQYFVNRLSGSVNRNVVRIVPRGNSTVKQNSSIEFDLPSDTICDLSTLQLRADFKFQNAVGGTNGVRAVPQAHTLFRNVQWSLNGNVVSGNNTSENWGQMYECLRRATGSETHENSNLDEYRAVPVVDSDGKFQGALTASESVKQHIRFDDFCGLQHSPNASAMDSAVVGDIRLRLLTAGNNIITSYADSGSNDHDWQLENVELVLECITFGGADNVYDMVMSSALQAGNLYIAYPEWYANTSSSNSAIKFNVATSSLDMIGFAPLPSEEADPTQLTSAAGAVADANCEYGPRFTQFKLQNASNAVPAVNSESEKYYWQINQRAYPQNGAEVVSNGIGHTKDCFGIQAKNLDGTNLLFKGVLDNDGSTTARGKSFKRENFYEANTVVWHKLCLDAPAHQNAMRQLNGINCQGQSSTITFNNSGWSSSDKVLLMAITSAVLEVGLGQQVSITY